MQTESGLKVTAKAPANIALIKFWGKRDEKLRIPMNNSVSVNLSSAFTTTSVQFRKSLNKDKITLNNHPLNNLESERITTHLDRIRKLAKLSLKAEVITINNFPQGSGIASSASGFAALSMAGAKAAGLNLNERQLSVLARLGSGSACRSIPNGWVEWKAGEKSEESFAYSLHDSKYWDVCDLIAIVSKKRKAVGSSEGHTLALNSPFYKSRLIGLDDKITKIKTAINNRDFCQMGEIVEAEALNMHAVMMTSIPALLYWTPETLQLMQNIIDWRKSGLKSYYTIDAGPNVHILCLSKDVKTLLTKLKREENVEEVIVNQISDGTKILSSV